jgi:hypothetical protein
MLKRARRPELERGATSGIRRGGKAIELLARSDVIPREEVGMGTTLKHVDPRPLLENSN